MTIQELLNQASLLSLPEQVSLATRLMELVEEQVSSQQAQSFDEKLDTTGYGSLEAILANPIPVHSNFKPLSRDAIYDRS
jgi:hypothetical protein